MSAEQPIPDQELNVEAAQKAKNLLGEVSRDSTGRVQDVDGIDLRTKAWSLKGEDDTLAKNVEHAANQAASLTERGQSLLDTASALGSDLGSTQLQEEAAETLTKAKSEETEAFIANQHRRINLQEASRHFDENKNAYITAALEDAAKAGHEDINYHPVSQQDLDKRWQRPQVEAEQSPPDAA